MSDEAKAAEQAQDEAAAETADAAAPAEAPAPPDDYDQLLRLKAEFENYRRRVDREKPEWFARGRAEVTAKLLPLYDLVRHAHEDVKAGHADSPLAMGMDAIFKEYEKLFKE